MKKKGEVKKLRLSRETLQTLTSSDTQKVVGGDIGPATTGGMSPYCATRDEPCNAA
jgi:hypothetical protein